MHGLGLTRFGKNFPFFNEDNIGDLLVICKINEGIYNAWFLNTDGDIEDFMTSLNLSPTDLNGIIPHQFDLTLDEKIKRCLSAFIENIDKGFPKSWEVAKAARECYNKFNNIGSKVIESMPDTCLLQWTQVEYQLFKMIEEKEYRSILNYGFASVEDFVNVANSILNRRKSRAGKSLENHLEAIFQSVNIMYTTQGITELNKRPDFIFPGEEYYHDPKFKSVNLTILAAKTTCKDRWRQVLNEADRTPFKHIFTLQQGISGNQLTEMYKNKVTLVVPNENIKTFPEEFRDKILTLNKFNKMLLTKQSVIK